MKQLTILCSSDLSDIVEKALDGAGAEGFLKVPGATGFKPPAAAPRGDTPRWPADLFVCAASDEVAEGVVRALREYAGRCEVEPCLRILVGPLEAMY